MAHNNKALLFLAFGTFCVLLGTGIICGGGFNSVMFSPTDGPYRITTSQNNPLGTTSSAAVVVQPVTTTQTVNGVTTTFTNCNGELVCQNHGHYASLLKQYPELFNWAKIADVQKVTETNTLLTGVAIEAQVARDAASAYTRYHAAEQAWIFALFLPLGLVAITVGVIAYFRKNGYTIALTGLGIATFMIAYTLIIVVHYQNISFVNEALNAFSRCSTNDEATRSILREGASFGTLTGPAPRRAWLCEGDWNYDNDFRTAANLVWGGASVCFVGYLSLLVAFAYLVQPAIFPAPAFAGSKSRSASLDFTESSDYYSEEY